MSNTEQLPWSELLEIARKARERAYAPYSSFKVGAALLAENGKIYEGCNVENLSYGLTICAERTAICSAVADGQRQFQAIAVVAEASEPISPCGACRQFLAEFDDMPVLMANLEGKEEHSTLAQLLPRAKTGILDQK